MGIDFDIFPLFQRKGWIRVTFLGIFRVQISIRLMKHHWKHLVSWYTFFSSGMPLTSLSLHIVGQHDVHICMVRCILFLLELLLGLVIKAEGLSPIYFWGVYWNFKLGLQGRERVKRLSYVILIVYGGYFFFPLCRGLGTLLNKKQQKFSCALVRDCFGWLLAVSQIDWSGYHITFNLSS